MTRQQAEPEKPEAIELDPAAMSADFPNFTNAEVAKIRTDAAAKVAKDKRQADLKVLMAKFEEEERAAAGLAPKEGALEVADEELQHIQISLPPFCVDGIKLDNRQYFHGHSYRVSPSVYASLLDQMQMSWNHEDQKDGKFTNFNRRERDTHLRNGVPINAPVSLNTRTSMN